MPTTAKKTTNTSATLPKEIFGLEVRNHELVKTAYHAYLASARSSNARVKTRGLVRGGGRKPWRQKGTGQARVGSSRNPIWRGGGIVFGPTGNENYRINLSTASKRLAIKQALSLANNAKKVSTVVLPAHDGKTKTFAAWLAKQNVSRRVLVVVGELDNDLLRATDNLSEVICKQASYLNVFDIVNSDHILIEKAAIDILKSWLIKDKTEADK